MTQSGNAKPTQEFSFKGKFFIVDPIDGNALVYDRKNSILARNKVARPHLR